VRAFSLLLSLCAEADMGWHPGLAPLPMRTASPYVCTHTCPRPLGLSLALNVPPVSFLHMVVQAPTSYP
jgi:hypothetical protein